MYGFRLDGEFDRERRKGVDDQRQLYRRPMEIRRSQARIDYFLQVGHDSLRLLYAGPVDIGIRWLYSSVVRHRAVDAHCPYPNNESYDYQRGYGAKCTDVCSYGLE